MSSRNFFLSQQGQTATAIVVPHNSEEARAFFGIPDYLPAPPPDEFGRRYVVIRGIVPGIYNTWQEYQQQTCWVSGAYGRSFMYPMEAWRYYESNRMDGQVQYLPFVFAPASWAIIPFTNPWPGFAEAFVVFRGTKPGIYKTWDDCRAAIIGCNNPRYTGIGTYSEAVFVYAKAQLLGRMEKVD